MTPLLTVARQGRGEAGWLLGGMLISLLSIGTLLALSVGTAGLALGPSSAGWLALPFVLRSLGVGRVALRYAERMVTHAATFRALTALRLWLFRALARRSAGGLGMVRAGDALSRLVGDVEALDGLYLRIAVPGLAAVLLLPVLVWGLASSAVTAVMVGGLFTLSALVLPWLAARGTAQDGDSLAAAGSGLRVAALDTIGGLREVLAYGAAPRMLAEIGSREQTLITVQHSVARRSALAQAGSFLCGQAALLAVVLGGGPALVPSLFLTLAAFEIVGGMARAGVLAGHASGAAARVVAAAEAPAAVEEPAHPAPLPTGTALSFDHITFHWLPGRPAVLEDFSLDIPAGSRVAILGPSGSGKSTLAALALKVAAPQSGCVRLGGADIATLSAADVRSRMAWVGQDTHLFQDSIRNNLLLARPGADDAALWQALTEAQLAGKIRTLPGGLDAMIGGTSPGLSGGEARRLALARALLSDAPLLILDEPTAGLDATTEAEFFRALNDTAPDRTVLLIVHRLLGVERLDRTWRLTAAHAVSALT